MVATIVDLRYKMKDVLKALNRREKIKILYHGVQKGIIIPSEISKKIPIEDHPFFGMKKSEKMKVSKAMQILRGNRHNDI